MAKIALSPPDSLFTLDVDQWTEPFWIAAREHRLVAMRCDDCGTFRMPPGPFCPKCQSQAIVWETLSGRGEVYSFTIVDTAIVPAARGHIPYVPAVVTLPDADGVRLISNIVDCEVDEIAIGAPLEVTWHDRPDGITIPRFRLANK